MARVEDGELAAEALHCAGDERGAGGEAGAVDEVAGGEVVAAIEEDVGAARGLA